MDERAVINCSVSLIMQDMQQKEQNVGDQLLEYKEEKNRNRKMQLVLRIRKDTNKSKYFHLNLEKWYNETSYALLLSEQYPKDATPFEIQFAKNWSQQ